MGYSSLRKIGEESFPPLIALEAYSDVNLRYRFVRAKPEEFFDVEVKQLDWPGGEKRLYVLEFSARIKPLDNLHEETPESRAEINRSEVPTDGELFPSYLGYSSEADALEIETGSGCHVDNRYTHSYTLTISKRRGIKGTRAELLSLIDFVYNSTNKKTIIILGTIRENTFAVETEK